MRDVSFSLIHLASALGGRAFAQKKKQRSGLRLRIFASIKALLRHGPDLQITPGYSFSSVENLRYARHRRCVYTAADSCVAVCRPTVRCPQSPFFLSHSSRKPSMNA